MNGGLLLRFAGTGWVVLVAEVAQTKPAARFLMSQALRNWCEPPGQTRGVGVPTIGHPRQQPARPTDAQTPTPTHKNTHKPTHKHGLEQGIAEIFGNDQAHQCWSIINKAAHPSVRSELWEEAHALGLA